MDGCKTLVPADPPAAEAGPGSSAYPVLRIDHADASQLDDQLAVEEPLEIRLIYGAADRRQHKNLAITMRTPGQDAELAIGFLLTEGIIRDIDDVQGVRQPGDSHATQNIVTVELAPHVQLNPASIERNFYVSSSCGVCGKASLVALQTFCPPRRPNRFRIHERVLRSLPVRLRESQRLFDRTGGLHAAGLFDSDGKLHALREDVGRHNAVDKLIGSECLADRLPLNDSLLLLSGRASFELLQKAVMGGIPMVACVGAPSSLAVKVAREFDVTLAGFLREQSFNLYNGAQHIYGIDQGWAK